MLDVAVVGAGLAGLVCARRLKELGHSVVVVEKSRGVGGRVATRRVEATCFDHGARYLSQQGDHTTALLEAIRSASDQPPNSPIQFTPWPTLHHAMAADQTLQAAPIPNAFAPVQGMTAIAKHLAQGLEIQRGCRVVGLDLSEKAIWELQIEGPSAAPPLQARAVILAIPAPQALVLLEPLASQGLPDGVIDAVRSVKFAPCYTAIAGYPSDTFLAHPVMGNPWDAVTVHPSLDLIWVALDSRKRRSAGPPILVIQSSESFAQRHLEETDLEQLGVLLFKRVAELLKLSILQVPTWQQVHRWRYAFCLEPLPDSHWVSTAPSLLGLAGDWCGGQTIEAAMRSGEAIAQSMNQYL